LKFYERNGTIVVAIRGTQDPRDLRADAMGAVGQIRNSERYAIDKDEMLRMKAAHPNAHFVAVGHSLGGAILDLFLRDGLIASGLSYNGFPEPQERSGNPKHHRIYHKEDLLYKLFASKIPNIEVRTTKEPFWKYLLKSSGPVGNVAFNLDSHLLDRFKGGLVATAPPPPPPPQRNPRKHHDVHATAEQKKLLAEYKKVKHRRDMMEDNRQATIDMMGEEEWIGTIAEQRLAALEARLAHLTEVIMSCGLKEKCGGAARKLDLKTYYHSLIDFPAGDRRRPNETSRRQLNTIFKAATKALKNAGKAHSTFAKVIGKPKNQPLADTKDQILARAYAEMGNIIRPVAVVQPHLTQEAQRMVDLLATQTDVINNPLPENIMRGLMGPIPPPIRPPRPRLVGDSFVADYDY
jgi:hypothetical protein